MFKIYFIIIHILRTKAPRCTAVPTGQCVLVGYLLYPAINCGAIILSPSGTMWNKSVLSSLVSVRLTELTEYALIRRT